MTYKEGQEVWIAPTYRTGGGRWQTIVKIGRKWAQLSDGNRFDVRDSQLDGGIYSSPGRVWGSPDACEAEQQADVAWSKLWQATAGRRPQA